MKIAKIFLVGMYIHLICSIIMPISIYTNSPISFGLFILFLVEIVIVNMLGWVTVGVAIAIYKQGKIEKLRASLKLLKFGSIPFYILNFIWSFFIWFILVGASMGFMILTVPIPIIFTCIMIFQSGCIGILYIKYLHKQTENQDKPSKIHYLLQIISVFDIISTALILKKVENER